MNFSINNSEELETIINNYSNNIFKQDNTKTDNLKTNIKDGLNDKEIEDFLDEVISDNSFLNNLSLEKLEKLNDYYDESIKNLEQKLLDVKK